MKKYIYLLVSCLLICSTVHAYQMDNGPSWEPCKVFDLGKLDNLPVAHVQPGSAVLDTSLKFDRIDPGTSAGQLSIASPERLHYRLIEPGSGNKSLS